jgi:hypothetical protein
VDQFKANPPQQPNHLSDPHHQIMRGHPDYYIRAPITHLWASYPIHVQLDDIVSHLEARGKLANGSWTGVPTTATTFTEWFIQKPALKHLCPIFNDIQSFVLGERQSDTTMVYAGLSVPTLYPEAMLAVKGVLGKECDWADVICPFESDYGHAEDVSALPMLANLR